MVPIETRYLMNTDSSNRYYFSGVTLNNGNSNKLTRVSKEALLQRNKKSYWKDNDNVEEVYKGVKVKFTLAGCSAGYMFPIVMQISDLTTAEMPFDEFLVLSIEGNNLSGDVDIYHTGPVYMCFMCSNCAQLQLFEWFYEKVTYPFIASIRKRFNPNIISESEII